MKGICIHPPCKNLQAMQKNLFLFIPALFVCVMGNSQKKTISGTVFNSKDKKYIPYVNIHIAKSNTFYDTDETGHFKIDVTDSDSLLFTCIGYDMFTIDAKTYHQTDSIFLHEKIYELENVTVKNTSSKQLGIIDAKQTRSFAGESISDNYEIATRMEIPSDINTFRITKVLLKQKNFSTDRPLRLHIYACDPDGLPGEELLKKQVIISESDLRNGILEIDIKNQNIILERASFFVGIQWITKLITELPKGRKNDVGIGETSAINDRLTFRRGRILNYKWYINFETGVYLPGNENGKEGVTPIPIKGNPINMLAAAVIETL